MDDIDLSNVNRLYTLLLLKDGEKHGYQLIQDIQDITGNKPSTSHIYPFLNRLEEHDLIQGEEHGNRGKQVYHLTDNGEELVSEQLTSFQKILSVAIQQDIEQCVHCGCKVYSNGHQKDGQPYCCKHCAEHHNNMKNEQ